MLGFLYLFRKGVEEMRNGKPMDRDFKGVWIPKEVWLNTELSALEKVIFVEIDSLDGKDGCWASNKYLAEFCQCSQDKITRTVKKLQEMNFIEVTNFDGRHRVIRVLKDKKNFHR